nr:AAA family ATPase [Franconibacter helveticus]
MEQLNIVFGPNGSGKSNIYKAIPLMQSAAQGAFSPAPRPGRGRNAGGKTRISGSSLQRSVSHTSPSRVISSSLSPRALRGAIISRARSGT